VLYVTKLEARAAIKTLINVGNTSKTDGVSVGSSTASTPLPPLIGALNGNGLASSKEPADLGPRRFSREAQTPLS
jgi:hypothetical protein